LLQIGLAPVASGDPALDALNDPRVPLEVVDGDPPGRSAQVFLVLERVQADPVSQAGPRQRHLADRAREAEQDVEGGFIVGLLALIGLVVVILVVLAVVNDDDE